MSALEDTATVSALGTHHPVLEYAAYPFDSDPVFLQGSEGILKGATEDNKDEIMRRARVFYFNRVTGSSITIEEALEAETRARVSATAPATQPSNGEEEPPQILTFAQLQELIESGKVDQIPNNKIISGELNSAPPSETVAHARKKPWEVEASTEGQAG